MWVSVDGDWGSLMTKIQTHMCKLRIHYRIKELQGEEISFKLTVNNDDYYIYLVKDTTYNWPMKLSLIPDMLKYSFFNVTGTYLKLKNPFVCAQCAEKGNVYVVQLFLPICILCLCYSNQFIDKFIY